MPSYYDTHAAQLAARYEALSAAELNAWFSDVLPEVPACVLDIGAGSGRDAAWLASLGFEVVAVEPSAAMALEARRIHAACAIQWIEGDTLPTLARTLALDQHFDFILLSAVWMHLPPVEQPHAFRNLTSLLKPGGRIAITLRHGPASPGQTLYETSAENIERLCREHGGQHGLVIERCNEAIADLSGRDGVSWTQLILLRRGAASAGSLPAAR